jgi:lipoprotein signal peptidase
MARHPPRRAILVKILSGTAQPAHRLVTLDGVSRFATLDLPGFPYRALIMASAAVLALAIDFVSKEIVVALDLETLLFNVSDRNVFGLGAGAILLAAGSSLLMCVLPLRVIAVGAGAALVGALGNLTSRHWWEQRGGSPDFIPFADGSTGNIADLFIALGAFTMLFGIVAWLVSTLVTARRAAS